MHCLSFRGVCHMAASCLFPFLFVTMIISHLFYIRNHGHKAIFRTNQKTTDGNRWIVVNVTVVSKVDQSSRSWSQFPKKNHGTAWKVLSQWIHMWKMKTQPLLIFKLWPILKFLPTQSTPIDCMDMILTSQTYLFRIMKTKNGMGVDYLLSFYCQGDFETHRNRLSLHFNPFLMTEVCEVIWRWTAGIWLETHCKLLITSSTIAFDLDRRYIGYLKGKRKRFYSVLLQKHLYLQKNPKRNVTTQKTPPKFWFHNDCGRPRTISWSNNIIWSQNRYKMYEFASIIVTISITNLLLLLLLLQNCYYCYHRKIQKEKWHHQNATKNFDYTTIADRLRTVSWSYNIYEYKIDTKCMNLQALLLLFLLQTCYYYYYYYKIVTIATIEKSKKKSDITKTPPRTSITQRSRTDLGRSVGVTTYNVNIKKMQNVWICNQNCYY